MSFLGVKDPDSKEGASKLFLVRTQASCLMVGVDKHSYTAFGFMSGVDDDVDDDPEPPPSLATISGDLGEVPQGVYYTPDRISGNSDDMEIPVLDVRRYFLGCLSHRLEENQEQWDLIVGELKDAFTEQVSPPPFFLLLFPRFPLP